jgi:aminopeptidase N
VDLGWRALVRLASLGQYDRAQIDALEARDPDPDSWIRALAVESARPSSEAKEIAWQALVDDQRVPMGAVHVVSGAFWQASQAELLAPFAERYLDVLPKISRAGMIQAIAVAQSMFPWYGVDSTFVDRAVAAASDDALSPIVSARVLEGADQLRRILAARG